MHLHLAEVESQVYAFAHFEIQIPDVPTKYPSLHSHFPEILLKFELIEH
jgi:hypothetical protein